MTDLTKTRTLPTWAVQLIILGLFFAISCIYFSPVLGGKKLGQSDLIQVSGMAHEINAYKEKTGETALWTNAMFGGMPTYQITGMESTANPFSLLADLTYNGLPQPIPLMILYLVGFYLLLLAYGISPWWSALGAFAYAFASYNLIIIEAGHYNKSLAIAYMPLVLAGIRYTYRTNLWVGGALTAGAVALEVWAGHPQITVYLLFGVLCFVIAEGVYQFKEKTLPRFLKASTALVIAAGIGAASYAGHLYVTYDYAKYTIRGNAELQNSGHESGSGLDKDYAFAWSYGKAESFTLLIPGFMGGSSQEQVSKSSETYKLLKANGYPEDQARRLPTYWGAQPFTSGPVYAGAIICFLFVLACFLVEPTFRYGLMAATVLSLFLAWGKNFETFNYLLFDHVPLLNKFRAVAMALVIAGVTLPLGALLGLQQLMNAQRDKLKVQKAIYISAGITGGLCLLFLIVPGLFFDFTGPGDEQMKSILEPLKQDRQSILRMDSLRSLALIIGAAAVLWAWNLNKLKTLYAGIILSVLIIVDLWTVDQRYINKEDFSKSSQVEKPFTPSAADQQILQDPDPNYRVLNTTVNTFNDASTSYFHKSIGGYHPAKLRRYQDLIERHISKNHIEVLNMLNTKYVIVAGEDRIPRAQKNPDALGNAWFVNQVKWVKSPDEEIEGLNAPFNPKTQAIIDEQFKTEVTLPNETIDSTAFIRLTQYQPNQLTYMSHSTKNELVVFSEIYFPNGWKVTIDGKPAAYFRANYVLRAMNIPAGDHKIVYRFEPEEYHTGIQIGDLFSWIIVALFGAAVFWSFRKNNQPQTKSK